MNINNYTDNTDFLPIVHDSEFQIVFPSAREKYIETCWSFLSEMLSSKHGIKSELDLENGIIEVKTTQKAKDPFIIFKARDLMKLIARYVPVDQAIKVLSDDLHCDFIKIKTMLRNNKNHKFEKRRYRLIGPEGNTLKALELLTDCYILVNAGTVVVMGSIKGIVTVRKVVEDCMKNIHPIYHIKRLMIKNELHKDEKLKKEDWSRFIPKYKKINKKKSKVGPKDSKKRDNSNTLFPPEKKSSKLETGEYHLKENKKKKTKKNGKKHKQSQKTEKQNQKEKTNEPPEEDSMNI